jgi:predicted transcriptional regulator
MVGTCEVVGVGKAGVSRAMQSFGPLEAVIMDRLWTAGRAMTGREVHDALERDPQPAYTTVTTVMDILCRKGFLRRERVGRAYRYIPAASREAYSAELMGQALSASKDQQATLLHFVGQLGAEETAALRAAIAHATEHPAPENPCTGGGEDDASGSPGASR